MSDFEQAKEVTVSDISGARMTVPPGVYYRGKAMTKGEYHRQRARDISTEQAAPRFDAVERNLEDILDVGEGT